MNLLIIYGTTEGQTRKICEFLRDEADKDGHMVELNDASEAPRKPAGYDAVIIGASVHMYTYQDAVVRYVKDNHEQLNQIVSAFMSVSLTAASDEPESWKELRNITEDFLVKTDWQPYQVEQVAGALKYLDYDFFKRFIMRLLSRRAGGDTDTSSDHEYTDWKQVRGLLDVTTEYVKIVPKRDTALT